MCVLKVAEHSRMRIHVRTFFSTFAPLCPLKDLNAYVTRCLVESLELSEFSRGFSNSPNMHEFCMHCFLIKKQNIKLIAIILKVTRKEENNSRLLEALYYYSQLWWLYKNEIITWDLCFNIVEFENLRGDSEWAGDSIRISSKFLRLGNSGVVAMWKRSTIFSEAIQVSWKRAKRETERVGGGRKEGREKERERDKNLDVLFSV